MEKVTCGFCGYEGSEVHQGQAVHEFWCYDLKEKWGEGKLVETQGMDVFGYYCPKCRTDLDHTAEIDERING